MANAVAPTSGTVATLLGAGVGYLVRRLGGPTDASNALVLLVAAAAYLCAALLTLRMAVDLLGPSGPTGRALQGRTPLGGQFRGVLRGLIDGARHLLSRRPATTALAVIGLHRLAFGLATVATILFSRYRLSDYGNTEQALGVVASTVLAGGLGFGLAAVVTPIAVPRIGVRSWVVTCSTRGSGGPVRRRDQAEPAPAPRQRLRHRAGHPEHEDLCGRRAAGEHRGRVPGPGLLVLRHDLQRRLRRGGRARRARAAAGRLLPAGAAGDGRPLRGGRRPLRPRSRGRRRGRPARLPVPCYSWPPGFVAGSSCRARHHLRSSSRATSGAAGRAPGAGP